MKQPELSIRMSGNFEKMQTSLTQETGELSSKISGLQRWLYECSKRLKADKSFAIDSSRYIFSVAIYVRPKFCLMFVAALYVYYT